MVTAADPARPRSYQPRDIVAAAALFALTAFAPLSVFAAFGPPVGDSFHLNTLWSAAFEEQFRAGELYPRWLFGMNAGAGSPVFYFYAPLPFWIQTLAAPLLCAGCSADGAVMAGPVLLLALSGTSFYFWIRSYVRTPVALFSAALYLLLPYHFMIDFWYRQPVGELAAYASMPLILLGLERASRSARHLCLAALGYAALLYSHLPSALLFSPLIVIFVVLRYRPQQWLPLIALPVSLGIALAAMHLVPALTTQAYINAAAWWTAEDGHYVAVNWLWLGGRDAPDPALAFNMLHALLAPSVMASVFAACLLFASKERRATVLFLVMSLLYAWFLMTAPSAFLWTHLTLLAKVQFPWRLGIVVDLCTAATVALSLQQASRRLVWAVLTASIAVGAAAAPYSFNVEQMRTHLLGAKSAEEQAEIGSVIARGEEAQEYRTAWSIRPDGESGHADLIEALAAIPHVGIIAGPGRISAVEEELGRLLVDIDAIAPVRLRFRRFYYPGWQLTQEPDGQAVEIVAAEDLGLIEASLPAGRHSLVLQRRPIAEERIGTAVSAAALLLCLLLLWSGRLPRWRPRASCRRAGGLSGHPRT